MDFRKRQKAMAIAAIFHKRRLQRRFDADHLGKIDIAFELFFAGALEIEIVSQFPSTIATRVSSGCVASTSIRFVIYLSRRHVAREGEMNPSGARTGKFVTHLKPLARPRSSRGSASARGLP